MCGQRCPVFCKGVTELCTEARAGLEADAYVSEAACLEQCDGEGTSGFPVDPNHELPATGDSVNCRIYHLSLAYKALDANEEQLKIHCGHTRVGAASEVCQGNFPPP